ncbi:MAG: sigma-70 family RNA polymerase sigma factor [Planctomycetes bacterium]|nr:sigma-70 family RNA polymerase sigma factor [Planctomycetota bacterium]
MSVPPRTEEERRDELASDQQLLDQFIGRNDETAFSQLVSRYGALVLGVCRRILRNEHSAEDAFQATFLVLAQQAKKIRNQSSLPAWLYAVAYRTAVRTSAKRHRRREESLQEDPVVDESLAGIAARYEQQLLDEEIDSLPRKYRDPLVLHFLLGKTNKQVAGELGLSVSAVEGRLKRGKERLRMQLVKRGVGLSVAVAALQLAQSSAWAAMTESLVATTAKAAASFAVGGKALACSQSVTQLVKQELAAMTTSTLAPVTITAAVLFVGLTLGLVGDSLPTAAQGDAAAVKAVNTRAADPTVAEAPAVRLVADPEGRADENSLNDAADYDNLPQEIRRELQKYQAIDMKRQTPVTEKISAALDEDTQMDFIDVPLSDVIEFLSDLHAISIIIDSRALDEVGLGIDTPVTRNLQGISLQAGLRLLLRDLELSFLIQDEVLMITSEEVADSTMETRVYSLHLLTNHEPEEIAEVIKATIRPASWLAKPAEEKSVGQNSIPAVQALGGCVVVTHNQQAHSEINDLLWQLDGVQSNLEMRRKLLERARRAKQN